MKREEQYDLLRQIADLPEDQRSFVHGFSLGLVAQAASKPEEHDKDDSTDTKKDEGVA